MGLPLSLRDDCGKRGYCVFFASFVASVTVKLLLYRFSVKSEATRGDD